MFCVVNFVDVQAGGGARPHPILGPLGNGIAPSVASPASATLLSSGPTPRVPLLPMVPLVNPAPVVLDEPEPVPGAGATPLEMPEFPPVAEVSFPLEPEMTV